MQSNQEKEEKTVTVKVNSTMPLGFNTKVPFLIVIFDKSLDKDYFVPKSPNVAGEAVLDGVVHVQAYRSTTS